MTDLPWLGRPGAAHLRGCAGRFCCIKESATSLQMHDVRLGPECCLGGIADLHRDRGPGAGAGPGREQHQQIF